MDFSHIFSKYVLNKNSDLWILPFEKDSYWFKKINWHLHFILLDPASNKKIENPLMILANYSLPCSQVLCLPNDVHEDWIDQSYEHWKNLNYMKLRLFLPTNFNLNLLQSSKFQKHTYNRAEYIFVDEK